MPVEVAGDRLVVPDDPQPHVGGVVGVGGAEHGGQAVDVAGADGRDVHGHPGRRSGGEVQVVVVEPREQRAAVAVDLDCAREVRDGR